MFEIGGTEILIIILLAVILFGPEKVPEIARTIGRFVAKAKKVSDELKTEINKGISADELKDTIDKATPKDGLENFAKSLEEGNKDTDKTN